TAGRGVEAGRTLAQRPGQHGPVHRHRRDAVLLRRGGDQQFRNARDGRRLQDPVRGRWHVVQAGIGAADADQGFGPVVPGGDLVVLERPVRAEAIAAFSLEIMRAETQRIAAPVVGASAQHARPPPQELAAFGGGVWLVRHLPAAAHGGIVETEVLVRRGSAHQWRVDVAPEHRRFRPRVVMAAGFQHQHLVALAGQFVSGHGAASAGADDQHVMGEIVHRFSSLILRFLNHTTSPWSCSPIWPLRLAANPAQPANLLLATSRFHSAPWISTEAVRTPFCQMVSWPWSSRMRTRFHSPAILCEATGEAIMSYREPDRWVSS